MVDAIEVGKVGAFCCTEVVDDIVPSFPFREGLVDYKTADKAAGTYDSYAFIHHFVSVVAG